MKFSLLSVAAAVFLSAGFPGHTEASSGDGSVSCSTDEDNPTTGEIDGDVVADGTECHLTDAIVSGSVVMLEGNELIFMQRVTAKKVDLGNHLTPYVSMEFCTIEEGVKGKNVESIQIGFSTLGRDVDLTVIGGDGLEIDDCTIHGKIRVEDSTGVTVSINSNELHDDVEIKDSTLDYISFDSNTMFGDEVKIESNIISEGSRWPTQVTDNKGAKNLKLKKNTIAIPAIVSGNNVTKIEIEDNTWSAGMTVETNCAGDFIRIKDNEGDVLSCSENKEDSEDCSSGSDSVTVEDNMVILYADQCEPVEAV